MTKIIPRWQQRNDVISSIYADLITSIESFENNLPHYETWNEFQKSIWNYYFTNKNKLIEKIQTFCKSGWEFYRLNSMVQAIILESVAEYHLKITPHGVLIQQAVITAKNFTEDGADKFIHSLLDKYFNTDGVPKENHSKILENAYQEKQTKKMEIAAAKAADEIKVNNSKSNLESSKDNLIAPIEDAAKSLDQNNSDKILSTSETDLPTQPQETEKVKDEVSK